MNTIQKLVQDLGVSKVKLAKYLGVSRQMVYNYLMLDSIDKWPKEKKLLLIQLLGIEEDNPTDESISKIKVTTDYLLEIDKKLNANIKKEGNFESNFDLTGLDKDSKLLLGDIVGLLKEKLVLGGYTNEASVKYVYYLLQSMNTVAEVKYMLGYFAKTNGFIEPNEFAFDEDRQFIFEGILYTGLNLYNSGGASKSRVADARAKFIKEIEAKNEEKLTRTEQLNTITVQALRELGYDQINAENAAEVFEKIAEIESRRV